MMVMPIHITETSAPEWPRWRWWLICIAGTSILFAGVWWFVIGDKTQTLVAAALPWAFALGCLVISLIWGIVTVPLMLLIAKIGGSKAKDENRNHQNQQGC